MEEMQQESEVTDLVPQVDEFCLESDPFQRVERRSLINLLPNNMQEQIFSAHKAHPELFGLDEDSLAKAIAGERGPGPLTNALRMKFWYEYDEAQAEHRKMRVKNIYSGVCEVSAFLKAMADPEKVAWVLTRPAAYDLAMQEMHQFSLAKMRKILETPLIQHGKYNSNVAKDQIKVFELLDLRIKGSVIQKTMNLHASVTPVKGAGATDSTNKEELERRIRELECAAEQQQGKIIDTVIVGAE